MKKSLAVPAGGREERNSSKNYRALLMGLCVFLLSKNK